MVMRRRFVLPLLIAALLAPGAMTQHAPAAPAAPPGDRLCSGYSGLPAPSPGKDAPAGMAFVPGGTFIMGSGDAYPEERPPRQATVGGFWIDRHEVTNAQFAAFVAATGYKTVAERGLSAKDYPDLPPEALVPGSMVFFEPPKNT